MNDLLKRLPEEGTDELAATMAAGKAQMDAEEKIAVGLVDRLNEHLHEPLDFGETGHLATLIQCDVQVAEIIRKIVATLDDI